MNIKNIPLTEFKKLINDSDKSDLKILLVLVLLGTIIFISGIFLIYIFLNF